MRGITPQFIRQLSAAANRRSDGDLLDGFLTNNVDADFAELVGRYGSMVWGVCRRTLSDRADAEDAFQTVFLVLVRRGRKLVEFTTIGPWLYRVAIWTTRNIRRRNAHRFSNRVTITEELPAAATDRDLSIDLDDALLALPEKFRTSIVLCHLLGFSRADAAAQLGCREGTLSSWLSRGLAKLRAKLGDRDPSQMLGIAALAVPACLSVSVVRAAAAFHATAAISSGLSSALPQLVEGVIRMLWVKKATAATVALFAMFAFGVGVGVSTFPVAPAADGQEQSVFLKAGVQPETPEGRKVPDEHLDFDKLLADLRDQLQSTTKHCHLVEEAFQASAEQIKIRQVRAILNKNQNQPTNPNELKDAMEVQERFQKDRDAIAEKLTRLKGMIQIVQDYKVQYEKAKQINQTPNDLEKQLAELKKRQTELHLKLAVESLNSKLAESAIQIELRKIDERIAALLKQKESILKNPPAANAKIGYFLLLVEAKDAPWPFVIEEYGPDGKLVGKTAFDCAASLGRFLARAMKDSTAPKEVRITAQNNTPIEMLSSAIETCKASGVAENYFKSENHRDILVEWLDGGEKLKNAAEKDKTYSKVINDLYSKLAETQKRPQPRESDQHSRDAARRAFEFLEKLEKDKPSNPPKP